MMKHKFLKPIVILFMALFISQADLYAAEYNDGEVIVKYKSGISATKSLATKGRSYIRSMSMPEYLTDNTYLIKTTDNVTNAIEDIMLYDNGDIEYVHPNYKVRALKIPNDPKFSINTVPAYQYDNASGINVIPAWDSRTENNNLIIGVLDTGILLTHEDLIGNIEDNGFDVYSTQASNSGIGKGNDLNGHGTHVAGIIGAVGDNNKGTTGVLWRTKLMPIRVLDAAGNGTTTTIVQGVEYAIKNGVKVINASYGGSVGAFAIAEYQAIKKAIDNGIVVVAAAGNDDKNTDRDPEYPAAFGIRGLISVGASDQNSARALFNSKVDPGSCYGKTSVHLFAPGERILSTYKRDDSSYESFSGTSMATPFVTGAVAMLLAKSPELTPTQVEMILINSVRVDKKLDNISMSNGRLDINAMMNFDKNKLFDPPTNLNYQLGSSPETVVITWSGGKGNTEIYEREEGGEFKQIASASENIHTYTRVLSGATGKRYYRIRSNSEGVFSPYVRKDLFNSQVGLVPEYINVGEVRKKPSVGGCTLSDNPDTIMGVMILIIILRALYIRRRKTA